MSTISMPSYSLNIILLAVGPCNSTKARPFLSLNKHYIPTYALPLLEIWTIVDIVM